MPNLRRRVTRYASYSSFEEVRWGFASNMHGLMWPANGWGQLQSEPLLWKSSCSQWVSRQSHVQCLLAWSQSMTSVNNKACEMLNKVKGPLCIICRGVNIFSAKHSHFHKQLLRVMYYIHALFYVLSVVQHYTNTKGCTTLLYCTAINNVWGNVLM